MDSWDPCSGLQGLRGKLGLCELQERAGQESLMIGRCCLFHRETINGRTCVRDTIRE